MPADISSPQDISKKRGLEIAENLTPVLEWMPLNPDSVNHMILGIFLNHSQKQIISKQMNENSWALEQIARRGCGISILEEIQN